MNLIKKNVDFCTTNLGGATIYYTPTEQLLAPDIREKAPDIREKAPDIRGLSEGFPSILTDLEEKLQDFGKRESIEKTRELIKDICSLGYIKPKDLSVLLERSAEQRLRNRYLTPMVATGELELKYSDHLKHPKQAYRTKAREKNG